MTSQNKSLKKGQQKMSKDSITTKTKTLNLKSHHRRVKSDQISLDTNNNNKVKSDNTKTGQIRSVRLQKNKH